MSKIKRHVFGAYSSRGTGDHEVVVVVNGRENRDVFEEFKKTIDKINRRRRHHGGEGIRFHISLVGTTSTSS